MIPAFDERGYLPPGVHKATIEEIEERFGRQSELRRVQMESLRWLIDLARRGRIKRIVINGSFVTDIFEPNDVDCVLLIDDRYPPSESAQQEFLEGFPFLEIHVVEKEDFEFFTNVLYISDRFFVSKGMVEVLI